MQDATPELLTTGDVARLADVTPGCVVGWDRRGVLRATIVLHTGVRLFARTDVEAFLTRRAEAAR